MINAVNNTASFLYHKKNNNVNSSIPTFKMAGKNPESIKKIPLEQKLKQLMYNLKIGDIITIGKSVEEVQEGLKRTLILYDQVIKNIMHIKDGGWSSPCAFLKDNDGDIHFVNIGDKDILVASDSKVKTVEPDDLYYIQKGDVIISNKRSLPFDIGDFSEIDYDNPNWIEEIAPERFATNIFNFAISQQQIIENANRKILSKLLQAGAKAKKEISFSDIGGLGNVIETLKREIVFPIKYPFAYENINLNKGVILYGKPGTGKTLLAQALANETKASFIKICGSEMESKWVGESEKNWRELFERAKQEQPSIIFIDEFDSVARQRGSSHDVYGDKVVNQILTLMSDIEKENSQIFVIAASNKPDVFDDAMIRSGRFGKHIEVLPPDKKGLKEILEIYLKNKNIDKKLDKEKLVETFAKRQATGADIKQIVNDAHINSWERANIYKMMDEGTLLPSDLMKVAIIQEDFEKAFNNSKSMKSKNERRPVGYLR